VCQSTAALYQLAANPRASSAAPTHTSTEALDTSSTSMAEQNPLHHMQQVVQNAQHHLGREWQRLSSHVEQHHVRPLQAGLGSVFSQFQPFNQALRHLMQHQERELPARAMLASFAVRACCPQPHQQMLSSDMGSRSLCQ
jgi:hypothetical protein